MLISLKLKINNYNNDICLLGIHLDPRLNWSNDINKVDCKLFRFLFLLSTNLKTFVPHNLLCLLCMFCIFCVLILWVIYENNNFEISH